MTDPVSTAFPASSPGSRGAVADYLKARVQTVFQSVAEVEENDLSGYRVIRVRANWRTYEHDPASTAESDGASVLKDTAGNRFVWRPDVRVDSLWDLYGEGAPDDGDGADGDTYFQSDTGEVWIKEGGSWTSMGSLWSDVTPELTALKEAAEDAAAEAAATAAALTALASNAPSWVTKPELNGAIEVAALQFEPGLGKAWLNAEVRDIADIATDHGNGSWTLTTMPAGIANGSTVMVEYEYDPDDGTASGYLFSQAAHATNLTGEVAMELFMGGAGAASSMGWPAVTSRARTVGGVTLGGTGTPTYNFRSYGSRRAMVSMAPDGGAFRHWLEGRPVATIAGTTDYTTPINFQIGRRAATAPAVIANATIKRLWLWPRAMSEAEMEAIIAATDPYPVPAQIVAPDWVPRVTDADGNTVWPKIAASPGRKRLWFNGAVRDYGDKEKFIRLPGDGSVIVQRALGLTAGCTAIADIDRAYNTDAAPVSGTAFRSFASSGGTGTVGMLQVEMLNTATAAPPGKTLDAALFIAHASGSSSSSCRGNHPASIAAGAENNGAGGFNAVRAIGVNRFMVSAPPGTGLTLAAMNMEPPTERGTAAPADVTRDYWRFGAKNDGTAPLTNCSLDLFAIWPRALTADECWQAQAFNEYGLPPFISIGDSLHNLDQPIEGMRKHLADRGYSYVPFLGTGLGGRSWLFFKEYLAAYLGSHPFLKRSSLVIWEGGLDFIQVGLDAVEVLSAAAATDWDFIRLINETFDLFDNPRHFIAEPMYNARANYALNSPSETNTANLARMITTLERIEEAFPDAFVRSYRRLQSRAADATEWATIHADWRLPSSHYVGNRPDLPDTTPAFTDVIHPGFGDEWAPEATIYWDWSLTMIEAMAAAGALPARP